MLIRNKMTKTVHEVAPGTKYPKLFFEEVTKAQLKAEKAAKTTPVRASESASKAPQTTKTVKISSKAKKKAPAKKKAANKTAK